MREILPKELLPYLSPDLQYEALSRDEAKLRRGDAVTALTLMTITALIVEPNLNRWLKGSAAGAFFQGTPVVADVVVAVQSAQQEPGAFYAPVNKGESIGGFTVTSGYGKREKPCAVCSAYHWAVDVGTPVKTPLHAIGEPGSTVDVTCSASATGGRHATIASASFPHLRFEALHLATCTPGTFAPGEVFATTGESGNAITGPSLDWRQYDLGLSPSTGAHDPGKKIHPERGYLLWTLTGEKPSF